MINVRSCLLITTRSRHQRQPSLPSLSLFVRVCLGVLSMGILSFWPFVLNSSNQTKDSFFSSFMIVLFFCVNIVKVCLNTCINHKALICCDTVFYLHDSKTFCFYIQFNFIMFIVSLRQLVCSLSSICIYPIVFQSISQLFQSG